MIEKIGHIKNPLTIIAIFAGIAEISGTLILPFIAESNQDKYVWFLMLFPALLVIIFFVTLWVKPKSLYAPSDYSNEDNFMRLMEPATYAEVAAKVDTEIAEAAATAQPDPPLPTNLTNLSPSQTSEDRYVSQTEPRQIASDKDIRELYARGEAKAFSVLANEFPGLIKDVAYTSGKKRAIFDGASEGPDGSIILFEIKVWTQYSRLALRDAVLRFASKARTMTFDEYKRVRLIVIVVLPELIDGKDVLRSIRIESQHVEIRYMTF